MKRLSPTLVSALFASALLIPALKASAEPHGIFERLGCAYRVKSTGCTTSYEEATSALRMDETTVNITVHGNSYTNRQAVFQFAMRRAAEETVADGFDLFEVVSQDDTTHDKTIVAGDSTSVRSATFTYPGLVLIIKLTKGAKPNGANANVFDAREVLKFMAPQLQ